MRAFALARQAWLKPLLPLTWSKQMKRVPSKPRSSIIPDYWRSWEAEVFARFLRGIYAQTASGVCCLQLRQCQVRPVKSVRLGAVPLLRASWTGFYRNRCLSSGIVANQTLPHISRLADFARNDMEPVCEGNPAADLCRCGVCGCVGIADGGSEGNRMQNGSHSRVSLRFLRGFGVLEQLIEILSFEMQYSQLTPCV